MVIMLLRGTELLWGLGKVATCSSLEDCKNMKRKSLWFGKIFFCFIIQKAALLASLVGMFPRDSS